MAVLARRRGAILPRSSARAKSATAPAVRPLARSAPARYVVRMNATPRAVAEAQPDAPLAALLPKDGGRLAPDAVLDRFVGWVASTGLALYPAQEEALLALLDEKHLVLATPTGSGKSLVAT